ncbi:MAG TPA: WD40 repeat domain-containing protein [Pirellulaceae bacterium]|nr:WD40 repeat domain-containing protein [Pirellulaceae bacterium]
MTRAIRFVVAVLAYVVLAPGADRLHAQAAISAANADKVSAATELPVRAHKILRGPGRGELTFLDWNDSVQVVDDVHFRPLRKLAEGRKPIDFTISRDGQHFLWNERGKTAYIVEEAATGTTLEIEIGKTPGFAAFSPDGKLLAIGSSFWDPLIEGAGFSEMQLFDRSGKLVRKLEKSGAGALMPVFSSDGKLLAVGNRNHQTQVFEVDSGKLLHTLDRKMTQEIAFSPDNTTLAAGYVDGMVVVWDMATGQPQRAAVSGCDEIYSVDWSPKGDVLVTSGRKGKIVLWDKDLARLKELDAPLWVIQARFTEDGARLLTSSASDLTARTDRKVVVWTVPAEK